jgi:MtN3 and saliva related transmembrane protein
MNKRTLGVRFMLVDLLIFIAPIAATLTFLPQVIKAIRTKSVGDLSGGMMALSILGNMGWLANGLQTGNYALIISAICILILIQPLVYFKIKEMRQQSWGAAPFAKALAILTIFIDIT